MIATFEIWKQRDNLDDAPFRRKRDRRYVFHAIHAIRDWPAVMALVGDGETMQIRYWGRGRNATLQVRIGTREFLMEQR